MKLPTWLTGVGTRLSGLSQYATAIKVGVFAALVLASGWFYHRSTVLKRDLTAAESKVSEVLAVNAAQTAALARLEAQRKVDEQTVAQLMKNLEDISTSDRHSRKKLADLERNNADVRAYLRSAVPSALNCVFDDSNCGKDRGGEDAPARGAAPAVSTAGRR